MDMGVDKLVVNGFPLQSVYCVNISKKEATIGMLLLMFFKTKLGANLLELMQNFYS